MKAVSLLCAAAFLACGLAVPAAAQNLAAAVGQVAPAAPAPTPLHLRAGTGVLLHLPSAATSVLSADPDVARAQPASPTSLFVMGVAGGQTTIAATNESGAAIAQYNVQVTGSTPASANANPFGSLLGGTGGTSKDSDVPASTAARIRAAIYASVPGIDGLGVRPVGHDVILTGTVATALAAQQADSIAHAFLGDGGVLDHFSVLQSLQVNVRVRIAEIDRNITRQLGFNWQALGANTNFTFGLLTGAGALGSISPLAPLMLTPLTNAPVPNQIGAGYVSKHWDINAVIDALAADQLITILAEPNLTARSGETASFLAGGEFPIPVSGNNQNGTIQVTIQFKQYGVSLTLVPTVLSADRINLRIRPEVSQLTNQGAVSLPLGSGVLTIPALSVRRAETTVELGSGQSFAIAGLLQRTSLQATNALPGIGELPVLGTLFKSNDFQRGQSELVIIVTPYVVQPAASPDALQTPLDQFRPATDLERILYDRQIAAAPPAHVDAGFILK